MARLNTAVRRAAVVTHEGAPAFAHMTPMQALRRSVMACLLWEDTFYEDGQSIAERIAENASKVTPAELAALAIEARKHYNLRHVPLLLLAVLAKVGSGSRLVGDTIAEVIQRADELSEFLAVYAKANGVTPDKVKKKMSAQVKRGLALAFQKFDHYQLAKYDRDGAVRLRDSLFLCHAKPKDDEQAALWKALVTGTLTAPDTWEVALSGGADKKETFERLLREQKLGYLALLRNLRNMAQAGCDETLVRDTITARRGAHRVLPFRYVAAARACPQYEPAIDAALCATVGESRPLSGKTIVLVDVSGSMEGKLSDKSDMTRIDAAASLASVINGDLRVFSFSNQTVEVPARRGMAGVDAIRRSQQHGGTDTGVAVARANALRHDRLIVITDEQSHTAVPTPVTKRAYMINVAAYEHGVGYGGWTHIDGFSEHVIRYIHEVEAAGS